MSALLAINWGMRGDKKSIISWLRAFDYPDSWLVIALLPAPYLDLAHDFLQKNPKPIKLGAQTVSAHETPGPYTGEMTAGMLAEVGAEYVLISAPDDSPGDFSNKLSASIKAGLQPLVQINSDVKFLKPAHVEGVIYLTTNPPPKQITAALPGNCNALIELPVFNQYQEKIFKKP